MATFAQRYKAMAEAMTGRTMALDELERIANRYIKVREKMITANGWDPATWNDEQKAQFVVVSIRKYVATDFRAAAQREAEYSNVPNVTSSVTSALQDITE